MGGPASNALPGTKRVVRTIISACMAQLNLCHANDGHDGAGGSKPRKCGRRALPSSAVESLPAFPPPSLETERWSMRLVTEPLASVKRKPLILQVDGRDMIIN